AGMQIFTNINGNPVDLPEYEPFFEYMAKANKPVWLHPARREKCSDYKTKERSEYEIWWALGWPCASSAARAHMVFARFFVKFEGLSGLSDPAGGMGPVFEGRRAPGWDQMAKRTTDRDLSEVRKPLERPDLEYSK